MNLYNFYIYAYMCELEEILNSHGNEFKAINFQLDEANTDKEAKRLIKQIIKQDLLSIKQIGTVQINNEEITLDKSKFSINDVLIPDEYTSEDKLLVKTRKTGIYVNPDLILKIKFDDIDIIEYIEIKSTKSDNIPGSSIQQIVPDEWVIFIKHNEKEISIVTGKYKNTINGTMQFPDRSPRPQVSFSTLNKWNSIYRKRDLNILKYIFDETEQTKNILLNDWQSFLAQRWFNVLKLNKKEKGEPWFNNNLRKFAVLLIEHFNSLTEDEKVKFINKIKENIDNE